MDLDSDSDPNSIDILFSACYRYFSDSAYTHTE